MEKLTKYSVQLGARGVVIHIGKHTTYTYSNGVEKMRKAIKKILPYASSTCPILLETPSGQGTENITRYKRVFKSLD